MRGRVTVSNGKGASLAPRGHKNGVGGVSPRLGLLAGLYYPF
jgi:hypothetical protein